MENIFQYVKSLLVGTHNDSEEDNGLVCLEPVDDPVVAVMIYPGGMTTTLSIPDKKTQKVESFIHQELSKNKIFHLCAVSTEGEFRGYSVWHDSSLYESKDFNRKASHFLGMPLYGKVIVVNGGVELGQYDSVPSNLITKLDYPMPPAPPVKIQSRYVRPEPQEWSSQSRSTPGKRSKHTSPRPTFDARNEPYRTDSTRPFSPPNKGSSNTLRSSTLRTPLEKTIKKPARAVRRSSRLRTKKRHK